MKWIEEQEPPALIPVEDMEKANPIYKQDKATLRQWIDPHKLKKVEGYLVQRWKVSGYE